MSISREMRTSLWVSLGGIGRRDNPEPVLSLVQPAMKLVIQFNVAVRDAKVKDGTQRWHLCALTQVRDRRDNREPLLSLVQPAIRDVLNYENYANYKTSYR